MRTLNRSKLNYKLRKIHDYPITLASAPVGFGKTTALHAYLDKNAQTVWFSMHKQDDELWAWQEIITLLNQRITELELPEAFPDSRKSLDIFLATLQSCLKAPLYIILDDVQINKMPKIMKMLSTYSYTFMSLLHFIIITEDSHNDISDYDFSNDIFVLTTDDFAFTKEETMYLCKFENIILDEEQMNYFYQYSNGWVIAIILLLDSYKQTNNFYYHGYLDKVIYQTCFKSLPSIVQEDFAKLSILKQFSLSFATKICQSKETILKLISLEQEGYFLKTVDNQTYEFIPLIKVYLNKQVFVSFDDFTLIRNISQYYLEDQQPLEAIELLLKINDYQAILDIFYQYSNISFSDVSPDLIKKVFKRLPEKYICEYPYIYLKWIADCVTNFPEMNGAMLLENFKNLIDEDRIHNNKEQLYGEYYFIHAFLHYNDIFKMMDDFKKSHSYFNGSTSKFAYPFMITSFGSYQMLFLYYNKIGNLEEIVDFTQQNLHYFIEISGGCHTGTEHLIKAEYAIDTGDYENVVSNAKIAYQQAIESNQFSGAVCCLFCLGRYMFMQEKHGQFIRIIDQLIDFSKDMDSPIIRNQIDCSLAYLYILNDEYDKVASWLKNGELENAYLLPEADITAYLIHGICLMKERNTIELKQLCDTITKKNRRMTFIYADIYVQIFRLVCEVETGNIQVALKQLKDVIQLCQNDHIKSPIIELSFAFNSLIEMYTPNTSFEEELLHDIKRYLENNKNCSSTKKLTDKEIKILKLYANGKKTKEIADIKCISINTVQTHIKSIYSKLQISTKIEAAQYYKNNYSN